MPTGIVYAIWSGLGIVLITAVAWVWAKQVLDLPALIGMALITAGVIVINVFSKSEGSATSDTQEQTLVPGLTAPHGLESTGVVSQTSS